MNLPVDTGAELQDTTPPDALRTDCPWYRLQLCAHVTCKITINVVTGYEHDPTGCSSVLLASSGAAFGPSTGKQM
jgi:hypothetical protein